MIASAVDDLAGERLVRSDRDTSRSSHRPCRKYVGAMTPNPHAGLHKFPQIVQFVSKRSAEIESVRGTESMTMPTRAVSAKES